MEFFAWFEATTLSVWVREHPPAFPTLLVLHALGMGFLAGTHLLICLRTTGWAVTIPLKTLHQLQPIIWISLAVAAVSGVLLLCGYPAKAITNPIFFLKLVLLAAGVWMGQRLLRVATPSSTALALAVAACWIGAITAGRLLAYTHSVLLASHFV